MLVITPAKYNTLKNDDVRRSYQHLIDAILDFRDEHPQATRHDLHVYAIGLLKGRTKHVSHRRK
jgi:hypothetical protein